MEQAMTPSSRIICAAVFAASLGGVATLDPALANGARPLVGVPVIARPVVARPVIAHAGAPILAPARPVRAVHVAVGGGVPSVLGARHAASGITPIQPPGVRMVSIAGYGGGHHVVGSYAGRAHIARAYESGPRIWHVPQIHRVHVADRGWRHHHRHNGLWNGRTRWDFDHGIYGNYPVEGVGLMGTVAIGESAGGYDDACSGPAIYHLKPLRLTREREPTILYGTGTGCPARVVYQRND
jgi:hypothetical protein